MREVSWNDLEEPAVPECYFCGFEVCVCDELTDQHEIDMSEIEELP